MTLVVEDLVKHFRTRDGIVRAVDGVSFTVERGQTLGLVGESGCGKSTTARMLVRLDQPTSGRILLDGEDVAFARGATLSKLRGRIQMVFQDPYASLDPRLTVGQTLGEVLTVRRMVDGDAQRRTRVNELLEMVGMTASVAGRYPHQLSGGQRQRVGIARALAVEPEVMVLDEPVSALDVSVRAEVMNLLTRLRDELGLTYVFISHDLGMVRHISDRIAVMYLGRVLEIGGWRALSDDPLHPYTRSLRDAVPVPDPELEAQRQVVELGGEVPDAINPPAGCLFHTRCPYVEDRCRVETPTLRELAPRHQVACHFSERLFPDVLAEAQQVSG
ncbi:MAG: ATP-binding cassette domain-containing protein [Propionibacteriales bacterium]|nr:ATP-binding cassette domain-containing protein [Propionibacteriales bacterium]